MTLNQQARIRVPGYADVLRGNRQSGKGGIYAVCSAHPAVIEAAVQQSLEDGSVLLVESTSSQVNQFGGYTGLTPSEFARFVHSAARSAGLPAERVLLGGDHLGPFPWRHEASVSALSKARALVHDCVVRDTRRSTSTRACLAATTRREPHGANGGRPGRYFVPGRRGSVSGIAVGLSATSLCDRNRGSRAWRRICRRTLPCSNKGRGCSSNTGNLPARVCRTGPVVRLGEGDRVSCSTGSRFRIQCDLRLRSCQSTVVVCCTVRSTQESSLKHIPRTTSLPRP